MKGEFVEKQNQRLAILFYAFLFGYVISFVFSGRVYTQVALYCGYSQENMTLAAMLMHMLGLVCAGAFLKERQKAIKVMGYSIMACIFFTPFYLLPIEPLSLVVYCAVSFFSGIAVACWGTYYRDCIAATERLKAMADALILANVFMIGADLAATCLSALVGFALSIFYLLLALVLKEKIHRSETNPETVSIKDEKTKAALNKALLVLFCFIVIITIDSGLMYGAFNQAYTAYEWLTSWYWAIPYIAALLFLRTLGRTQNGTKYLYLAIGMIAAGFTLFYYSGISVVHYILIDTLLLGAAGVLDLFWSSFVGEALDYSSNPIRVLSIGWSANVLGVLIGSLISVLMVKLPISKASVTIVALIVACASLMILPTLLMQTRELLKNYQYLSQYAVLSKVEQKEITKTCEPVEKLTAREAEVLELLLQGYTNQDIAKEGRHTI